MTMTTTRHAPILLTGLIFATAACGADTDLEEAFCTALASPASATVTATEAMDGAPDVTATDRVDIELVESAEGYVGFVHYTPDESGNFAFGLSADVPFAVFDSSGASLVIENTVEGSEMCSELAVRHTVNVAAEPIWIELGPTDAATIGIVAEESDDDL